MLLHKKCKGVVVQRFDNNDGTTEIWTIDENLNKNELIYIINKKVVVPNIHCLECGKEWFSLDMAKKECNSFSLEAQKNLKIIFTSISIAAFVLFLSSLFDIDLFRSIVISVSFFILLMVSTSKQICEIDEINKSKLKAYKKYETLD